MKRIAVFGASGFGREVLPVLRHQLESVKEPYALTFVDDHPISSAVNGCKVLSYSEWMSEPAEGRYIVIAIANSSVREQLSIRCAADGVNSLEVRAANVVQLDDVAIGEGAILCPFATLTSNIKIGRFFHANIYSYVAHDCTIGDYVTSAPGAKCNGNVVIEDHAYIGTGAIIKQGRPGQPLVIGQGATIGMGAVVTKSIPAGATVIGNPARPMA